MVANLTVGKKGYEEAEEEMKKLAVRAQQLKDEMLKAVDEDSRAFNRVIDAYRMPKVTEEQVKEKEAAVELASQGAALVPFGVLEKCVELLEAAMAAAERGNKNSLSDAGMAGLLAEAAAEGAYYNVKINLLNIKDTAFKEDLSSRAKGLSEEVARAGAELRATIASHL
jgi:glutamate formiminotransferase/formiminotetrahydrofolate cyclodeaminase